MFRERFLPALLPLMLGLAATPAAAQPAAAPTAPAAAPAATASAPAPAAAATAASAAPVRPSFKLPALTDIQLEVARPVRAATAALGLGRQRLALVVGFGRLGTHTVLDSAARDVQAVATVLRQSGYVVMQREDLGAAGLRSTLREFHDRLQPGGIGFVYVTGLGAQVDGRNLLLPRDAVLDAGDSPAALAARLRAGGVPLAEIVDALMGTAADLRLLVVDAAYRHPVLARLPAGGLAEPRLPPGTLALFGQALGTWKEVAAAAPLPAPAPGDAREIAASRFARALVAALTVPRVKAAEALRATRKALVDASLGQEQPWLSGDTDEREEFAEPTMLDGLVPRTPEDYAREAAKQAARALARSGGSGAGDQTVDQVLQQASTSPSGTSASPATPSSAGGGGEAANPPAAEPAPPSQAVRAPGTTPAGSLGNLLGSTAGAVATAGGAAVAMAGIASARVGEATVAVSAAGSTVGVVRSAASVAGGAASMAAQVLGGGGNAEPPAQAARQLATATASAPAAAAAATATATIAATPRAAAMPAPAPVPALAGEQPVQEVLAAAEAAKPLAARRSAEAAAAVAAAPPVAPPPPRDPRALDGRTTRNADGGERPAWQPRVNAYGYAEGDTYTYQVIDTWKGEVAGHYTTAIDEVRGDGQLVANGSQLLLDAQGRTRKLAADDGSVSQYEPAQALWWSDPKRGQSRSVKFTETFVRADRSHGQTEWTGSSSVGRLRKVELPAGEFEVLPIESSGWFTEVVAGSPRNIGRWSRTVWYAPRLGHPVAIDSEDTDRLGRLLRRERVELLHAQSARLAP